MTAPPDEAKQLVRQAARIIDGKKGRDIVILRMTDVLPITDYCVIATGQNPRQIKAIVGEIHQTALALTGRKPFHVAGDRECQWVVMDYGSAIIHLFDEPTRKFYDLELLWGDAPRLGWQKDLSS